MSTKQVACENSEINISNKPVVLRYLKPTDLQEVRKLCEEWFPVQYPDTWYHEITSHSRFYSLAAEHDGQIIGLVVAEIRVKSNCNRDEQNILDAAFPPSTKVVYILSLGVVKDFRCNGVASLLLDELLYQVSAVVPAPGQGHSQGHGQGTDSDLQQLQQRSRPPTDCKAVYLHVLCTNLTAITFYERRRFHQDHFLPYYYNIKGVARDGYCYVRYINGGYAPWSIIDYVKHMSWLSVGSKLAQLHQLQPCCALPRRMLTGVGNWVRRLLPQLSTQCQSCLPGGAAANTEPDAT